MTEREFLDHLRNGEAAPLYLLHGEEQFLVERYASRLVDRLIPEEDRDFNLDIFQGSSCQGEEILNAALSYPIFARRRVVWIRHAEAISPDAAFQLIPYIDSPNPSTTVLFHAEKIDLRKTLFAELKKKGVTVEFKKPRESELGRFIVGEVRERGKKIHPDAVDLLALLVGTNLQEMAREIEKIVLHAGEKETIELSDVRSITSESRVETIFALTDAIGAKQVSPALKALSVLVRENTSLVYIVTMIIRYIRQLMTVRSFLDRGVKKSDRIAAQTGISPFVVGKLLPAALNFDSIELRRIYPLLLEADLDVKGGSPLPVLSVEQLVTKICGAVIGRREG
ncbi:MAG: DNA polymerase III subunit delta [Desulfuromonadia bacterium]